jgi:hypothetical protein
MQQVPQNFSELADLSPDRYGLVRDAISILREYGWAVAVLTAEELDGVDAARIEEGMVEDGFERVSYLRIKEES